MNWPSEMGWYWMRYKLRPKSKYGVLLVWRDEIDGTEYVQPHGDKNCYSKSIAESWQARFLVAQTPPTNDQFDEVKA